ncbi:putative endoplasmic reticulum junction formation protein lunapark [[Candida] jaroonii]|uniref:Endoplasmic reticulum junction formation protein lunapark n=1 Tax=[Candida] jaroonii TaxID=467808 RepID=A0ACA9YF44_9ASCO|nr:putative endoplasmic reticulum junction formation protein lunapark [[Candida] jaroonii]
MAIFGLFKSGNVDIQTFEKDLNQYNLSINKFQQQIIKLRKAKTSITKSLLTYSASIYVIILGYTIIQLPNNNVGMNQLKFFFVNQSRLTLYYIFGIPVAIYLIIISIRYILNWLIQSRENIIKGLKKKQKQKVEELKKLTNYNTTNELLSKYDETKPKSVPKTTEPKSKKAPPMKNQPPQSKPLPKTVNVPANQPPPIKSAPTPPPLPTPPGPKSFQDRLLDMIIGADDSDKYALICKKCFNHCGLSPPNEPFVKFICPYCKFMNGDDGKDIIKTEKEQIVDLSPKIEPESAESVVEPETAESTSEPEPTESAIEPETTESDSDIVKENLKPIQKTPELQENSEK